MKLTRCPIDGSIIYDDDGEPRCIAAGHGPVQWERASTPVEAPNKAEKARREGEPCETCGRPKARIIAPDGGLAPYAVCGPCRGLKGGHRSPSPAFSQWTMQGPDKDGYYFEGNVMTR